MQEFENIEEMIQHAKKKALRLLEVQDRTEQQLYQKLIEQGYPESVVEQAIFYVKSFHYIDDSRYAGNYVRYRQETKSKRQLKLELYKKGVPSDVVEQVLEEEYEGDERELIRRHMEKKHFCIENADVKERNRMIGYLLRRGFSLEDIRCCMKMNMDEM